MLIADLFCDTDTLICACYYFIRPSQNDVTTTDKQYVTRKLLPVMESGINDTRLIKIF